MKGWMAAFRLLGLGWYIVASILLGLVGGLWVDSRLHTSPWFTLLGLLLGLVVAFVGVLRLIKLVLSEKDK